MIARAEAEAEAEAELQKIVGAVERRTVRLSVLWPCRLLGVRCSHAREAAWFGRTKH